MKRARVRRGVAATTRSVRPLTGVLAGLLVGGIVALGPAPAAAFETWDGRVQLHGFVATQLRWLSDGFDAGNWYHSQWANQLGLELEVDVAPDGWGPFDLITAFARVEVRFECIFSGCAISGSYRRFGDRATRAPARNWRDGVTGTFVGDTPGVNEREFIHGGSNELLTILSSPLLEPLSELGASNLEATFEPVEDDLFAWREYDGTREEGSFQQGPWSTRSRIDPIGKLRFVDNHTIALPMRPAIGDADRRKRAAQGIYAPSQPLRERIDKLGPFDQNFTQEALQWNHGGGQDTWELKEAYVDVELFDSRLWLRIGLQNIVWGKTELFRTTDNFNPQDIGLSSLPSLEESRLALWSVRAVWSFYEVGPLLDVRLEVAANLDDHEPIDLGRCGEPYTVWLVCGKSLGLWGHGVLGLGLAGEIRPPDWWSNVRGVEVGARLEWRWDRFSFALSDFYGYTDGPTLEAFHFYSRNVDPSTGRPLDSRGEPLTPGNAVALHSGNRQFYDIVCSATVGVAAELIPGLEDVCLVDLFNAQVDLVPALGGGAIGAFFGTLTPAEVVGSVFSGSGFGGLVTEILRVGSENVSLNSGADILALIASSQGNVVPLNRDPRDGLPGPGSIEGLFPGASLSSRLTDQQEALLGCGPFYRTNCDVEGVDLFNAEATVLIQAFPNLEPDLPVATRFVDGHLRILPGARGPGDPGYSVNIDGTPPPGFDSELEALSFNFGRLLAALALGGDDPEDCDFETLQGCNILNAVIGITGVQRPEIQAGGNGRFGRRDFVWHGGGEALLFYPKRNVLGFSADFAEDRTKTNWNLEATWIANQPFPDSEIRRGYLRGNSFNLTISGDRPTFVNFLNQNRTFFINTQWFFQYLPDYDARSSTFNGPFNVLFTVAVATGYFQDRLLPSIVWVHDLPSGSGGILPSITYRYSQDFSVSVGLANFYGNPQKSPVALHQLAISNNGGDFRAKNSFRGLSAIKERDEVWLRLRYTF